jgi:hypothetical protein
MKRSHIRLQDSDDGIDGHYCIGKMNSSRPEGETCQTHRTYWSDTHMEFCATGTTYIDRRSAFIRLKEVRKYMALPLYARRLERLKQGAYSLVPSSQPEINGYLATLCVPGHELIGHGTTPELAIFDLGLATGQWLHST